MRARLAQALPAVRDLWFTSRRELTLWDQSHAPLYVSWRGETRALLGPRFAAIRAASFAPQLEVRLAPEGVGRTRLSLRWTYPFPSLYLLVFWAGILVLFAQKMGKDPSSYEDQVIFAGWLLLVAGTALAPLMGGFAGRAALLAAVPELERIAGASQLDDEDW